MVNQIQERLNQVLEDMKILRENKGHLEEDCRFSTYRYLDGQKFGLEVGLLELKELQGVYNIAMQEITRLRKLLGYDVIRENNEVEE